MMHLGYKMEIRLKLRSSLEKGDGCVAQNYSSMAITGVAGAIAQVMGINPPQRAQGGNGVVTLAAQRAFGGRECDRVFIYNPDAVALWLYKKYTQRFAQAIVRSRLQIPMLSVMPSVTPVCFASMYSGAMPEVHGIQAYEKPVLAVDTLFDALLRGGKKPAIVSTAGDSISHIFLKRDMDYFILDTADQCNEKAMQLIEEDGHDFIALYNPNYDSTMHRHGPEDAEALTQLDHNIATYARLHDEISRRWQGHRTMIGFCPDHGCHQIDGGMGSHGLDMAEDMNVIHLYDFI